VRQTVYSLSAMKPRTLPILLTVLLVLGARGWCRVCCETSGIRASLKDADSHSCCHAEREQQEDRVEFGVAPEPSTCCCASMSEVPGVRRDDAARAQQRSTELAASRPVPLTFGDSAHALGGRFSLWPGHGGASHPPLFLMTCSLRL